MADMDSISPWDRWSDDEIREWARRHRLDRYPVALVPLMSASVFGLNTVRIRFHDRGAPVERFRETSLSEQMVHNVRPD